MASLHDSEDPGVERICGSILETIGNTPLVRLSRLAEKVGIDAEILAKLEFFNPLCSVKDRIGLAMIEDKSHSFIIKAGIDRIQYGTGHRYRKV